MAVYPYKQLAFHFRHELIQELCMRNTFPIAMLEHALIATSEKRPTEYLPFRKWDQEGGGKTGERRVSLHEFVSTLIKQRATCRWVLYSNERVQLWIPPVFTTDGDFSWVSYAPQKASIRLQPLPFHCVIHIYDKHALPWERSRATAVLSFPKHATFRINICPCLILSPLLLQPTQIN